MLSHFKISLICILILNYMLHFKLQFVVIVLNSNRWLFYSISYDTDFLSLTLRDGIALVILRKVDLSTVCNCHHSFQWLFITFVKIISFEILLFYCFRLPVLHSLNFIFISFFFFVFLTFSTSNFKFYYIFKNPFCKYSF